MEYAEARAVVTRVVDAQVSETEPAARAQLSALIDQSATNLAAQPERIDEAQANLEDILRTSTNGPYDSPEPQFLTTAQLELTLGKICPPPVFPICSDRPH